MDIWIGKIGWLIISLYLIAHITVAQEITIEASKRTVSLDEPFTLKLLIKGIAAPAIYSAFPEYQHLHKQDVSSATSTDNIKGVTITTQTVSQNYLATQEGNFTLPAAVMTVNGQNIDVPAITLEVKPPADPNYKRNNELYEELLEIERRRNQPVDVNADAFFSLSTDKENVYTGEGFMVMLALYVADSNKVELKSYKVDEQLIQILQKIRPSNCWEENFNIKEFQEASVTIENKKYTRYTIYQTIFYPLNNRTITFPKVGLTMIKYKGVPNAATGEVTKKAEYETFYTTVKKVQVMSLPPHPLKEQVPVGVFRLKEAISSRELITGKGFNYHFNISGEGNLSAVHFTPAISDKYFDFFPPRIVQEAGPAKGKITGIKSFQFHIIPKEPGLYVMQRYFEWIFFNTKTHKYDTLSSSISVNVIGEGRKNADVSLNKLSPVYKTMLQESSRLSDTQTGNWVQLLANICLTLMLLAAIVLFFIRR